MTLKENLRNALEEFLQSNLLSADTAISNLLRATTEDNDLCAYIESNGHKVVFDKEFKNCFQSKQGYSQNVDVCIPFVYALLYSIDVKTFTLESFLETAYPNVDIDVSYAYFAFATATALKNSLEKVEFGVQEFGFLEPEVDYSDMLSAVDAASEYLNMISNNALSDRLFELTSTLKSSIVDSNDNGIVNAYFEICDMFRANPASKDCLEYLKSELNINV